MLPEFIFDDAPRPICRRALTSMQTRCLAWPCLTSTFLQPRSHLHRLLNEIASRGVAGQLFADARRVTVGARRSHDALLNGLFTERRSSLSVEDHWLYWRLLPPCGAESSMKKRDAEVRAAPRSGPQTWQGAEPAKARSRAGGAAPAAESKVSCRIASRRGSLAEAEVLDTMTS